jgi:hypothetical protein
MVVGSPVLLVRKRPGRRPVPVLGEYRAADRFVAFADREAPRERRLAAQAAWGATVLAVAYVFLEHPSSLEHDTAAHLGQAAITMHPEQPGRIVAIEQELSARGWLGFERMRSPAVDRSVLTAVHPEGYVASIERACASGGGLLDADTPERRIATAEGQQPLSRPSA